MKLLSAPNNTLCWRERERESKRERVRESNGTFDTNYHKMSPTKRERLQNESKDLPQRFSDNLALSDSHHIDWSGEGLCMLLVCCPANTTKQENVQYKMLGQTLLFHVQGRRKGRKKGRRKEREKREGKRARWRKGRRKEEGREERREEGREERREEGREEEREEERSTSQQPGCRHGEQWWKGEVLGCGSRD